MITVLKAISQWTLSFFHMLDGIYVTHGISYLDLMVGLYILGLLIRFMMSLLITGSTQAVREATQVKRAAHVSDKSYRETR